MKSVEEEKKYGKSFGIVLVWYSIPNTSECLYLYFGCCDCAGAGAVGLCILLVLRLKRSSIETQPQHSHTTTSTIDIQCNIHKNGHD